MASEDMASEDGRTLDLQGVAAVLGVEPAQVLALVEQDLLHPQDDAAGPRFDANEVRALHDLGG